MCFEQKLAPNKKKTKHRIVLHCIFWIEYVLILKDFFKRGFLEYSDSDIHPDLQMAALALIVDKFLIRTWSVDYSQSI